MCHRRRMSDQAFYAAQRLRQGEDAQGLHETAYGLHASLELEAQHGAKSRLLQFGYGMARMWEKPGIVHGGDFRMTR